MLAQNFMKATELEIAESELQALIKVLGLLERGELTHTPCSDQIKGECFSMNMTHAKTDCGTAHCIGGWVATITNVDPSKYVYSNQFGKIGKLYFPWGQVEGWSQITTEQAASALRSFLTHGDPRWKEAMRAND